MSLASPIVQPKAHIMHLMQHTIRNISAASRKTTTGMWLTKNKPTANDWVHIIYEVLRKERVTFFLLTSHRYDHHLFDENTFFLTLSCKVTKTF